MLDFITEKMYLREVLLFLFNIKKTSAESCRMLVDIMLHQKTLAYSCFEDLRTAISTCETRNAKEHQKNSKVRILKR